jgi:hypothetical protein
MPLESRHLLTIDMTLHPTIEVGATPIGTRRIFTVSGGRFMGERMCGDVLPDGSSDWLTVGADGAARQNVRLILRADDGSLILMTYQGVRHASADVNARVARDEIVSRADYYLRTTPTFETAAPQHDWLNRIVTVAIGERRADGVSYEVFEIL